MGSKREYINSEGLRLDGRRATELRTLRCKLGTFSKADGSAYLQQGNTRVLAAVYGPREAKRGKALFDRAILTCEFGMASFSTGGERRRRTKGDRRSAEMAMLVRETFEGVLFLHLFPNTQIKIFLQVLQADGGILPACINATTLALMDAGVPMKDFVVACSSALIDSTTPIVDLNYLEEGTGSPECTVSMLAKSEKTSLCQMDSKVSMESFETLLSTAHASAKRIHEILDEEVRKHTEELLQKRGFQ